MHDTRSHSELINESSNYWRDQSVRMRRPLYDLDLVKDEIFVVWSSFPDTTTGPTEVQPFGLNLPPIPFPSFSDLNIEPIDFVFPEFADLIPESFTDQHPGTGDSGGRHITDTRVSTKRETVPGTIVAGSGDTYSVQIYPNGLNNYLDDALIDRDVDNIVTSGVIIAKHPQMDPLAVIPPGTWVWVWRLVKLTIIETTIYGVRGEALSKSTSVNQTSLEDILMHPVWV